MKINVLGTEYSVEEMAEEQLPSGSDGFCDNSVHLIGYSGFADELKKTPEELRKNNTKADLAAYIRQVKRHELVHAFLFESGLAGSSSWALNEEMVDWFAAQGPKICKAWQEAGAL